MLGRLRLLHRLSSLNILSASLLLASSAGLNAGAHLPVLIPPPRATLGGKEGSRRPLLSHHPTKNRRARWLYTRATQTEGASNSNASSLFSPYLSARIRCRTDVADILSEALLCFGANSASMDDLDSCEDVDETWITSIFADGQDVHTCISHAADSIGLSCTPSYEVSVGEQYDWVTNVQDTFHPIEVIDGLWIIPKWRTPLNLQATNVVLDPGMAFGTGEHPTTKLCLLLLHGLIKGGEHLLDYGTGSGVLGIAAIKLGAALSVGIDIDPQAVMSARQNIALNEIDSNKMLVHLVPSRVRPLPSDGKLHTNHGEQMSYNWEPNLMTEKFDIVIANLLLNPLLELAEDIVALGKPGAKIGLSGILSEQVEQIEKVYSRFLDNISVSEMDGWACVHGTRKHT